MRPKTSHLVPAICAGTVLALFLGGLELFALSAEANKVNALAPWLPWVPQAKSGTAWQRAALEKPDLLVVYGSSEMNMLTMNTHYRAFNYFASYPTGFMVMDISRDGSASLNTLESLAAIGPGLKGKKVVISFTPSAFWTKQQQASRSADYAANFSHLHADESVFSPYLDMDLKQVLAKRMLYYPATLDKAPLLDFELRNLAQGSPLSRVMYYLTWPLGELETWVLELQDHAAVLDFLGSHGSILADPHHRAASITWAEEISRARQEQIAHSSNNRFGVESIRWTTTYEKILNHPIQRGSGDANFIDNLQRSPEWADFDLMLRFLKESGANPLLLSRPSNGLLLNAMGISAKAQNLYYDKLGSEAATYQIKLVDFRRQTDDLYFSIDVFSHTSREGWVYVDQALDAFYHNRLP